MGTILLYLGIGCVFFGIVMFIVYLVCGKTAGNKLKEKLMNEIN